MVGGNDDGVDDKKECSEENEKRTSTTTTAAAAARSQQETTAFERQQEQQQQQQQRVQTELRIALILKNDLEVKLDRTQKELIQAQTKVYTTSKKHEKIMNYINWLDYEYKPEEGSSSSRRVSTKFIRDNLL